jgi:hypothetical protein
MVLLTTLTLCFLFTACDSNLTPNEEAQKKISIEEATKLILASPYFSQSSNKEMDLIEITPSDIWDTTKLQIFKITGDSMSSGETFIVTDQEAIHIGIGFGMYGITSAVPYDVNKDGTVDIVYAYSYGSGIHRSVISWIDLKSFTEHIVGDIPKIKEFRTYDLILKIESNEIVVNNIKGMKGEDNFDSLRTYPTENDIDNMTLEKVGILIWENNELYNKQLQN